MGNEIQRVIDYFKDAVIESGEIIAGYNPEDQADLIEQRKHFVVALAALEQQKLKSSCNICSSDEIEKLLIMKNADSEYLAFLGGTSVFPRENHANFCPKCGRKLEG